jgi:leucyl aminopeptidase (aminopeptidase T)
MEYTEIANKIINDVLKIKPGQSVTISAEIHNVLAYNEPLVEIPFLEELALQIRKQKALPTIDISTENLHKRFFEEIADHNQSISMELFKKWLNTSDIFIDLSWRSNPQFYKSIPERYYKRQNLLPKVFMKQFEENNKKLILLGYPTKGLAKYLDVEHDLLEKIYFSALNIDYFDLKKRCLIFDGIVQKNAIKHIVTEKRILNIELKDRAKCLYGDWQKEPIMILPTGMWQQEINLEKLTGIYFCHQIYHEQNIWKDVQLIYENGKITDVETDNKQRNVELLKDMLRDEVESVLLNIGLNEAIAQKSLYSLFDMAKSKNLSLVINTERDQIIALAESAMILDNEENIIEF